MRNLIKRYIINKSRDKIDEGVTEDDINEIKQDVSAFRFELLEVLHNNGMEIPDYSRKSNKTRNKRNKKNDLSKQLSFGYCVKQSGAKSRLGVLSNQQDSFSSSMDENVPDEKSTDKHHHHLSNPQHSPGSQNHHNPLVRSKLGQIMMKKFHRAKSRSVDEDDGERLTVGDSMSSSSRLTPGDSMNSNRSRPVSFLLPDQRQKSEETSKSGTDEAETRFL